MSDTADDKGSDTPTGATEVKEQGAPAATPVNSPAAPQGTETHPESGSDSPTREEFQTLTGTVQQLVDMVASLVPQARDTTPVKTPWYARGKK